MKSNRLILIRHGHTASNSAVPHALMSGWTDLPLSGIGRRQVENLRQRFWVQPRVDAIYSSPLQRARHTAHGLLDTCRAPLRLVDGLREIDCGNVDGIPILEVQRRHPDLWEENQRQENADFRWPSGESYREFRERSLMVLQAIASAHPGKRIMIVTHCGFISQILGALYVLNPARWEQFRPGNASVTELEWGKYTRQLISFNDCSHLNRN